MGQYHYTVNLTKKEFLDPHKLGDGLKLLEQCGWCPGGTNDALHMLLACSSGRGGGDFRSGSDWIGHWAGDQIAVVGDYAEDADLPKKFQAASIYGLCREPGAEDGEQVRALLYRDITAELLPILEQEYEIIYYGEDFTRRVELSDVIEGWQYSHWRDGRVACIKIADQIYQYAMPALFAAVRTWLAGERSQGEKFNPVQHNVEQLANAGR